MPDDRTIRSAARAVASLAPAVVHLRSVDREQADNRRAIARGHYTPEEEDRLRAWFARYLTVRAGLLETVEDLRPYAQSNERAERIDALQAFAIAFTAACMLVRMGRFLVDDFATERVVQRKLNEAAPHHRIPRKQYTAIRRSLTNPLNAWRLRDAMAFADAERDAIDGLRSDSIMAPVIERLREYDNAVRVAVPTYLKARLRYRWHSYRRRRSTAVQQCLFALSEGFGRVIADMRNPWHRDRVRPAIRDELTAMLEPGDVVVTRHDHALSNLFLPGYWPHASLHIGLPEVREAMGIAVPEPQRARWVHSRRVLEARKDGVLFRTLDDTLAVDSVVVLRPTIGLDDIGRAIANAVLHEGKLYNFDFDFFTDDRLVCTEVIYRAYQGVGGICFDLAHHAGRLTLPAEDIITMAIEDRGFKPVALFGIPRLGRRVATGQKARRRLEWLRKKTGRD